MVLRYLRRALGPPLSERKIAYYAMLTSVVSLAVSIAGYVVSREGLTLQRDESIATTSLVLIGKAVPEKERGDRTYDFGFSPSDSSWKLQKASLYYPGLSKEGSPRAWGPIDLSAPAFDVQSWEVLKDLDNIIGIAKGNNLIERFPRYLCQGWYPVVVDG